MIANGARRFQGSSDHAAAPRLPNAYIAPNHSNRTSAPEKVRPSRFRTRPPERRGSTFGARRSASAEPPSMPCRRAAAPGPRRPMRCGRSRQSAQEQVSRTFDHQARVNHGRAFSCVPQSRGRTQRSSNMDLSPIGTLFFVARQLQRSYIAARNRPVSVGRAGRGREAAPGQCCWRGTSSWRRKTAARRICRGGRPQSAEGRRWMLYFLLLCFILSSSRRAFTLSFATNASSSSSIFVHALTAPA